MKAKALISIKVGIGVLKDKDSFVGQNLSRA